MLTIRSAPCPALARKLAALTLLAAALLLAPFAAGSASADFDTDPDSPLYGNVLGRVVSARTGAGINDARVIVYETDYRTVITETTTSDDSFGNPGLFSLWGVESREITIRVEGPGIYWSGWLACDNSLVATPSEACTTTNGYQGSIRLGSLDVRGSFWDHPWWWPWSGR